MNWWIFVALIVGWLFTVMITLSILTSVLSERRTVAVESVAVFCVTVMFIGLLVVLP